MDKYAEVIQALLDVQDDPQAYMDKLALDLMMPEQMAARMSQSAPAIEPHLVDFGLRSKAVQGMKGFGQSAGKYLKYAPAAAAGLPLLGALIPSRPAPPPSVWERLLAAAAKNPALAVGGVLAGGAGLGYLASRGQRQQQQPAPMGV
jgi:hypothetical protein